jgi:hypothetical protein
MKHYIQFKHLSTGYIDGSIPPQFSKDSIKPIDKLGSDGIFYLDNRLNLDSMINKGIELCEKRNNKVGFSINRYSDTILQPKEIHTLIFK